MMHITQDQLDEIRARLAQRPPNDPFTSAEGAIYTGRSTRTLKRAIDAGVGPRREKNPDVSGMAATNRHTRYRKADLDQWRDGLIGFTTKFWDFDDLVTDAPWLVENDRIVGHLMDLEDIDTVLLALGADTVVFLRLDEALRQSWADAALRASYQEVFERIRLQALSDAAAAAQTDASRADICSRGGEDRGG
jgi:hypothetical protein